MERNILQLAVINLMFCFEVCRARHCVRGGAMRDRDGRGSKKEFIAKEPIFLLVFRGDLSGPVCFQRYICMSQSRSFRKKLAIAVCPAVVPDIMPSIRITLGSGIGLEPHNMKKFCPYVVSA